jgi:hypothetical protein
MSDLNEQQTLAACPFCGADVNADDEDHKADCYFTVQREGGNDRAAWNRRAPAAAPAPVAASDLPKWIDSQKGRCPETDALIEYIEKLHAAAAPIVQPVGDERAADAIVTALYRRFKDWSKRGFGPDDVTWCEVKADVMALVRGAAPVVQAEPAGEVVSCEDYGLTIRWKKGAPTVGTFLYAAPTAAAADAKDAARYRWLRNEAWGGHVMSKGLPHVVEYLPGLMRGGRITELAEEALDTAIDAAIATSADEVKS